mmetsp:Transcript_69932/g.195605  ORF Transcript_69932/g.195605 Transcript_69932/m.195605 type:complete len:342 (-) Transcript_69932:81-1106(-)
MVRHAQPLQERRYFPVGVFVMAAVIEIVLHCAAKEMRRVSSIQYSYAPVVGIRDPARGRHVLSREQPKQRGFAGTARTRERDQISTLNDCGQRRNLEVHHADFSGFSDFADFSDLRFMAALSVNVNVHAMVVFGIILVLCTVSKHNFVKHNTLFPIVILCVLVVVVLEALVVSLDELLPPIAPCLEHHAAGFGVENVRNLLNARVTLHEVEDGLKNARSHSPKAADGTQGRDEGTDGHLTIEYQLAAEAQEEGSDHLCDGCYAPKDHAPVTICVSPNIIEVPVDTLELLGFSETGSKIGDKVADRGALNNEARPLVVGFHGCNVLFDDCVLAPKEDSGLAD